MGTRIVQHGSFGQFAVVPCCDYCRALAGAAHSSWCPERSEKP